ncbi:hypothetical protein BMS3Abin03_02207 [bacterium BMS3Abin03]|nr:hypothetical protein BMS3Abin03_02207 [bacterium BMS3Abin03]
MKMLKLLLLILLFPTILMAESKSEGAKKDTLWTPNGIIGLNLSQIAFSNWAQGGDNTLTFAFFSILGLDYIGYPWTWTNALKLSYGRTKIGNEGYRTNDNEIYFESVLVRRLGWKANPYASATFKTALTKGFNYDENPAPQIVDFFDPAYFTQGIGFQYGQGELFIQRLGISFKQTVADRFSPLYSDDPATSVLEKFKFESGLESVTEIKYEFLPNMVFYTYLRLFTRFDAFNVWDVRWDNLITAKINEYFNVNFNVLLIYDESQSIKRQLKQALQFGISYSIF